MKRQERERRRSNVEARPYCWDCIEEIRDCHLFLAQRQVEHYLTGAEEGTVVIHSQAVSGCLFLYITPHR